MFGLGATEIGIIVAIILLLFGPKQIPRFAKSIGETIRELRRIGNEAETEPKKLEEKK